MEKLKIGVIGAGSISQMHLQSYANNEYADLVAVCDLNGERAAAKAKAYGALKTFTDYTELLADPDIDAVSICTWNHSHAEISMAALKAGKHVLCEKPLCRTVEEAVQVQKTVQETGKLLQVGFVRRFAATTDVIRRFIDNDEIGEIYYAKATCLRRVGNPGGWFSDVERSGGGPLIDIGVHVIDLCWYLMGRPKVKSISGSTYKRLGNRANVENYSFYKASDYRADHNTVEDLACAFIRFDNGATLSVDVSFTLHAKQDEISVKLYGEKGGIEAEPELALISEKYNTMLNMTPQIDHLTFDFEASFQNEIDQFVECCLGRRETISPVEDGVEMMKILCGIYESSEKGQEIYFD